MKIWTITPLHLRIELSLIQLLSMIFRLELPIIEEVNGGKIIVFKISNQNWTPRDYFDDLRYLNIHLSSKEEKNIDYFRLQEKIEKIILII